MFRVMFRGKNQIIRNKWVVRDGFRIRFGTRGWVVRGGFGS